MLRITRSQTDKELRWTLCGQLTQPWVAELRECWEQGNRCAVHSRTVVDLSDVTFIDESGERLLSEMRSAGAEFLAAGVDTRHLLKNLEAEGERPVRRFLTPLAEGREKW